MSEPDEYGNLPLEEVLTPEVLAAQAGYNPYRNLSHLWDNRWTPVNDQLLELLNLARLEAGGTKKRLAIYVGIRPRQRRRYFNGNIKAMSFRVADQIFCRTEIPHRLLELEWLTVQELLDRGIWHAQFGRFDKRAPGIMLPDAKHVRKLERLRQRSAHSEESDAS